MTKLAKLSSLLLATVVLSGCTYSSDAIFPSLFGDDSEAVSQENEAAEAGIVLGTTNFEPVTISEVSNTGTFVGQKVITFRNELSQLQSSIKANNAQLQGIRDSVVNNALQYHKTIGMIEAKLQVGTTPGNPRMFEMLAQAQNNIQVMSTNSATLNQLSAKVAADTANTDYLVESIRSAYSISGAVDEDHRQLRILENETNQTSILINSLLGEVNSDISRQRQYIESAKNNIVDLSEAIKVGSYGVANAPLTSSIVRPTGSALLVGKPIPVASGKPLFTVKFNRDNVNYEDGLEQVVSSAMDRKPNVFFDVVAISPMNGSTASKNMAQKKATAIFQDMINMGVSAEKISISSRSSAEASSAEVQIFVR